jgi:hypothetical protein
MSSFIETPVTNSKIYNVEYSKTYKEPLSEIRIYYDGDYKTIIGFSTYQDFIGNSYFNPKIIDLTNGISFNFDYQTKTYGNYGEFPVNYKNISIKTIIYRVSNGIYEIAFPDLNIEYIPFIETPVTNSILYKKEYSKTYNESLKNIVIYYSSYANNEANIIGFSTYQDFIGSSFSPYYKIIDLTNGISFDYNYAGKRVYGNYDEFKFKYNDINLQKIIYRVYNNLYDVLFTDILPYKFNDADYDAESDPNNPMSYYTTVTLFITIPIIDNINGVETTVLTIGNNSEQRIPILYSRRVNDGKIARITVSAIEDIKKKAILYANDKYITDYNNNFTNKFGIGLSDNSILVPKKINIPMVETIPNDIIAKEFIPVIENDIVASKQIGIKSDGSIVLLPEEIIPDDEIPRPPNPQDIPTESQNNISQDIPKESQNNTPIDKLLVNNTRLYILLIILLVISIVIYMDYLKKQKNIKNMEKTIEKY